MDKNLSKLAPSALWKNFEGLCQHPHPSNNEEAARVYIRNFIKSIGLDYTEDEAHNILVKKAATPGMENRKTIVLQAHVDMVPQKNSDKEFNFDTDAIEAYIDGEWVTANGTTLGADNGIGLAAIMAVLEDNNLKHGPIEALFTATEETGMDGAFGLKAGMLNGEIMLNTDSETEGELYVGCAGGMDFNATLKYGTGRILKSDFSAYRLEIKGLKGGHSGMEIILQRANSNKLMCRFLKTFMDKYGILLCNIDGGGLRNAIPREAFATVAVLKQYEKKFLSAVKRYEKLYQSEFKGIEDSLSFKAVPVKCPSKCIDIFDTQDLIDAVVGLPNGIVKMSTTMPGLVQTSTNLARVVSEKGKFQILCLLRSSVRSEKEALAQQMKTICEMAGASVKLSGSYDGWNPNPESPILHTMQEGYKALYGKEPKIMAIHAGLECGIIGGIYPKMDMISFGPTICYPHSPDEKVNIASVEKFYNFLCYTLENAPLK